MSMSTSSPEPSPQRRTFASTKAKQRKLLLLCLKRLRSDPHVVEKHPPVLTVLQEIWFELRNSTSKPAPPTAARCTPELRAEIRAFAAAHPDMTMHDIGLHFGVQEGRVSEAINGKRK